MGRSRPAVANALRLLSLSKPVLELLEKGELSAGHARALVPIQDGEKQLAAAKEVIDKALSVRKTEQLAGRMCREDRQTGKEDSGGVKVDYCSEVSRQLSAALGRKVRLVDGKKTGRIEIEFYGADDREALISLLEKAGKNKQ